MDNQNRELQRQEPNGLKIGEQKFLSAKKSPKISEASEDQIAGALKYGMMKIGLREKNWPSDLEKILLISHLVENFGHLTVEEIRLAFDWGIGGRTGAEMNCYENFSCLFLTGVMSKYEALERIVKIAENRPKENEPPKPVELTEKEAEGYEEFMRSEFAKKLQRNGVKIPKF